MCCIIRFQTSCSIQNKPLFNQRDCCRCSTSGAANAAADSFAEGQAFRAYGTAAPGRHTWQACMDRIAGLLPLPLKLLSSTGLVLLLPRVQATMLGCLTWPSTQPALTS